MDEPFRSRRRSVSTIRWANTALSCVNAHSNLFDAHVRIIRAEIESLGDHQWAGEYYRGDGLGTNAYVHVAPHAGIAFSNQGCIGRPELNFGSIRSKSALIQADWKLDDEHASDHPAPVGFEKYLELESIDGRVVAVSAPEKQPPDSIENRVHYIQTVTINIGAANGVISR
jgi:hypothetical protein